MSITTGNPFVSDTIETEYVDGPNARYAYRRFGKTGAPPLVMCMRFRGTIDHWDPALLDLLAAEREVIIFDNVGTASSTGSTPTTFQGLGGGAVQFIEVGFLVFDMLTFWASFRAVGASPELALIGMAYLIGQLGNWLPVPGGIGGTELGLVGALVLYGFPPSPRPQRYCSTA